MDAKAVVSCCGVNCSACESFPGDCAGCPEIRGKVFWLEYTDEAVCPIYQCCVMKKRLAHCGLCGELPCAHYERGDPTKSEAENRAMLEAQIARLRGMMERDGA